MRLTIPSIRKVLIMKCRCIAEENERVKTKNAQIILVNTGEKILPCVATEKINKSIKERIPIIPIKYCPFCGMEL